MNPRQAKIIELLNANAARDLYEGSAPNGKHGSGAFWVTRSAGATYEPLNWDEVRAMADVGLVIERWPGCYTTPTNLAAKSNRR